MKPQGGRHRRPRRQHAVLGAVRAAGPGLPRQRAAAGDHGARLGRGRPPRSAGTATSARTGRSIGMHTFGASAPIKDLLKKFGFTPEKVVAAGQGAARRSEEQIRHEPAEAARRMRPVALARLFARSFVEKGELRQLIERDGLKGLTSNPVDLREGDRPKRRIRRAAEDLQRRAITARGDLRASRDRRHPAPRPSAAPGLRRDAAARDGYVSLECSPYLADDTEGTIAEALRLWAAVDRPNLMVKVPAHAGRHSGHPAPDRQGLNINITLLFARRRLRRGRRGLSRRARELQKAGGDIAQGRQRRQLLRQPHRYRDRQAARKTRRQGGRPQLHGKVAIANAKLAYARYKRFRGPRWESLPRRARRRSACSGHRPAARTRLTRTRSMSRR